MNIVKVKYFLETTQETSAREYTYFSEDPLKVGDMVLVPMRNTVGKAKVTAVDVPEAGIAAFKDRVKTIPVGSIVTAIPKEKEHDFPREPLPAMMEPKLDQIPEAKPEFGANDLPPGAPTVAAGANVQPEPVESIAIIHIKPEADLVILSLLAEANRLLDYAEKRVILTDADMETATNDLTVIARVKKSLLEKKAEYWKPIKVHLDAITASFQTLLTPIEDADRVTRGKWTAYRNEQTRRKAEADKLNQDAIDLARRQATFNGGEITVDLTPAVAPTPVAKVRTDLGSAQTVKTRKYRVVNFALLPDAYKLENSALLNRVTKSGIPEIDGVEFYFEEGIRVNVR